MFGKILIILLFFSKNHFEKGSSFAYHFFSNNHFERGSFAYYFFPNNHFERGSSFCVLFLSNNHLERGSSLASRTDDGQGLIEFILGFLFI